jgi:hypothetical protein
MKSRLLSIVLLFVIIGVVILSRLIANSDFVYAQIAQTSAYKFFYCPYNNYLYKGPNAPTPPYPYRNYPSIRIPYPSRYPLPQQYPCPCNTPAINLLLEDGR